MLVNLRFNSLPTLKLNSDYTEVTNWLFQQFPSYQVIGSKAYKPTLDNTLKLLASIDNPDNDLKYVHIAGSNGKGSTSAMIASSLTEAGYKVGLFTSPHIKDYRERIRINGDMVSESFVVDFVQSIRKKTFDFSPSFFEVTFALALSYFQKSNCDICIIETGLGGRLDATNVISPLISIITSISLEHTNILGESINEIAKEKAGIIKKDTPVMLGKLPKEAVEEIKIIAKSQSAPLKTVELLPDHQFSIPLLGTYQRLNLQLAYRSLEKLNALGFTIKDSHVQKGLDNIYLNTGFYGRMQQISEGPRVILDVSHNPEGIGITLKDLKLKDGERLFIIYGSSSDKNIGEIIKVFPNDSIVYFTEFQSERSCHLTDFKSLESDNKFAHVNYFKDAQKALDHAKKNASVNDTILVIGSFFLVSDFF